MKEKFLDTPHPLELGFRGILALAGDVLGESGVEAPRLTYSTPGGGALKAEVDAIVGHSIVCDPAVSSAAQTYDPSRGIWLDRCREEFNRHLHDYDGCPIGKEVGAEGTNVGGEVALRTKAITAALTAGAWTQARDHLHQPGFFSSAPPAISLSGFVLWYDCHRKSIQLCDATGRTGREDEAERAREVRCRWYVDLPKLEKPNRADGRRAILEVLRRGNASVGEIVGLSSLAEHHPRLEFWAEYLGSLLRSTHNPDHVHALIQEFMGACLLGTAPRHLQRGIILWGPPGSGKSVLLDLVGQRGGGLLLPPQWVKTGSNPGSESHDYQLGAFQGIRLNVHDEMTALRRPRQLASYITGQTINARKVGGDPFDLVPTAGFITSCNNPPKFWGDIDGFERRMLVIRFGEVFATASHRGRLSEEEIWSRAEAERTWIYLWALEGAARLAANGAPTIPPDCPDAWAAFVRGSNPIHEWLEENIEPGGPEEGIPLSELLAAYNGAMESEGAGRGGRAGKTAFGRNVHSWYRTRAGRELKPTQHRLTDAEGRRRRADVYHGIRWRDERAPDE